MAKRPSQVGLSERQKPKSKEQLQRERRAWIKHEADRFERAIDTALPAAARNPRDDGVIIVDTPYYPSDYDLRKEIEGRYLKAGWSRVVCLRDDCPIGTFTPWIELTR